MKNRQRKIIWIFGIIALLSVVAYLAFWMLTTPYDLFPSDPVQRLNMQQAIFKILNRRFFQVLAMLTSAALIASTALVFQTITNNRILTPSLIGFDSIFVLAQTMIVFFLTSRSIFYANPYLNYLASAGVMIILTLILYAAVLRKQRNHIIFLLLIGLIISTLTRSIAQFLQTIMDPEEFQYLTINTEVSITNMNTSIIILVVPLMLLIIGLLFKNHHTYDVMSLGEKEAISLGVDYQHVMHKSLIYIAIAMSISTALIGPISFLGLIAVNISRELLKSYKHKELIILSSFIAIIFIVLGQTIVSEFEYRTTVPVFISMFGGMYMIYLILKENKI
jgi:iron complex transport system permease protein